MRAGCARGGGRFLAFGAGSFEAGFGAALGFAFAAICRAGFVAGTGGAGRALASPSSLESISRVEVTTAVDCTAASPVERERISACAAAIDGPPLARDASGLAWSPVVLADAGALVISFGGADRWSCQNIPRPTRSPAIMTVIHFALREA
ncbi:MAG: hypothetical protein JRJ58_13670 [Deltaproteobacteria bacterium]|nr:hypothetical protein [Deltaproteobacteria bacterium]